MGIEEDFVIDEIVDLKINDRVFKYKRVTAGDEIDWLPDYMEQKTIVEDNETKVVYRQNLGKVNECKLRNIIEVPYSDEDIEKVLGVKKSWKDLDLKDRNLFFRKMNPNLYSELIKRVNEVDAPKKA